MVDPSRGAAVGSIVRRGYGELIYRVPAPRAGGAFPRTAERWLARYAGGWQLLFPNTGDAGSIEGVEHSFNGDADDAVWEFERPDARHVIGTAYIHGFLVTRSFGLSGELGLTVETRVQNCAGRPSPFLWTEHPAFLAGSSASVEFAGSTGDADSEDSVSTGGRVRLRMPEPGDERLWRASPSPAIVRLRTNSEAPDITVIWDSNVLDAAWLWLQNGVGRAPFAEGPPCVGIEPTNAMGMGGLAAAVKDGTAAILEPGAVAECRMTVECA